MEAMLRDLDQPLEASPITAWLTLPFTWLEIPSLDGTVWLHGFLIPTELLFVVGSTLRQVLLLLFVVPPVTEFLVHDA